MTTGSTRLELNRGKGLGASSASTVIRMSPTSKSRMFVKKCGHDHYIYFKEKEKALREEIKVLEDTLFHEVKNKIVPGEK